jgi:hypothetical protein
MNIEGPCTVHFMEEVNGVTKFRNHRLKLSFPLTLAVIWSWYGL